MSAADPGETRAAVRRWHLAGEAAAALAEDRGQHVEEGREPTDDELAGDVDGLPREARANAWGEGWDAYVRAAAGAAIDRARAEVVHAARALLRADPADRLAEERALSEAVARVGAAEVAWLGAGRARARCGLEGGREALSRAVAELREAVALDPRRTVAEALQNAARAATLADVAEAQPPARAARA